MIAQINKKKKRKKDSSIRETQPGRVKSETKGEKAKKTR